MILQENFKKLETILQELKGVFILKQKFDVLETTIQELKQRISELMENFKIMNSKANFHPQNFDQINSFSPPPSPSHMTPSPTRRNIQQKTYGNEKSDIEWPNCTKCSCLLELTWPRETKRPLQCGWCGVLKGTKSYAKYYLCGCVDKDDNDTVICLKCAKSCDGYTKNY